MKLQILVPQYKEPENIIRPLLDSIEIQQGVDLKNDVGVIIVNDGTDVHLSREFLDRYSYRIDYYLHEHKGVSATRNTCLDYATADYVMFCDADDMFYHVRGIHTIFEAINKWGFDSLVPDFIEEKIDKDTGNFVYVTHKLDSTFVHGKVHRRQYLVDKNIRWNEELTLHEDGYFNTLCHRLTKSLLYLPTTYYLWKWRKDSVCRSDPKWIVNTYEHCIKGNAALVEELLRRGEDEAAQHCTCAALYGAYYTLSDYAFDDSRRAVVAKDIKDFYLRFKDLYENIDPATKNLIEKDIEGTNFFGDIKRPPVSLESWLARMGA